MSNSEYEDREMEYLIESGTEGEQGEKPDITEEEQEENPEVNDRQIYNLKGYPPEVWENG